MANTGKFCQESTILKRLDFPVKTMWIFSTEQKIWQQKDSRLCFGILFSKLVWPSVRKNWSSAWKKLLKLEAEGREFAKNLRSLEQFIWTVKGMNNFGNRMFFQLV